MIRNHGVERIIIRSETEAWSALEKVMNDYFENGVEITFDGWPEIQIKIHDESYNSSLTAKNMEGLIELQTSIYRIFAQMIYDKLKATHLSDEEKKSLEITFKVSPGCSDILAELKDFMNTLAKGMVTKMEPKHYLTAILSISVIIGGTVCYRSFLQSQQDMYMADLELKDKKIEIQARQYATDAEYDRMELLANAYKIHPQLELIHESSDSSKNVLFKSMSNADSVSIAGVKKINGQDLQKILKKQRSSSIEDRLDGIFKIENVDTSSFEQFKLKFRNIEDGTKVSATINDSDVLKKKMRNILQGAEWQKKPVLLQMNIKRKKGVIVDATVLRVEAVTGELLSLVENGFTDLKIEWDSKRGFVYEPPSLVADTENENE